MQDEILEEKTAEPTQPPAVTRSCTLCGREFTPNKYRPIQKICSAPECQLKRQYSNVDDWRRRNPNYFRVKGQDIQWKLLCRKRSRTWRKRHQDYPRKYRRIHRQDIRLYMREYMRRYRAAMKKRK